MHAPCPCWMDVSLKAARTTGGMHAVRWRKCTQRSSRALTHAVVRRARAMHDDPTERRTRDDIGRFCVWRLALRPLHQHGRAPSLPDPISGPGTVFC
jgi:hypothetical protein